jgi:hypothetical protein
MSERAYDLAAVVAAHRASAVAANRASRRRGTWLRLSDAEYDAIAETVMREQRKRILALLDERAAAVQGRLAALPND